MSTTGDICVYNEASKRGSAFERVANFFKSVHLAIRRLLELKTRRDAFLVVAGLDDRILADIGLSRVEVETAANLPLEINASHAVRHMAANRLAEERRLLRR